MKKQSNLSRLMDYAGSLPDFSQAGNVTRYGWSTVLFAVISIVVYIQKTAYKGTANTFPSVPKFFSDSLITFVGSYIF